MIIILSVEKNESIPLGTIFLYTPENNISGYDSGVC